MTKIKMVKCADCDRVGVVARARCNRCYQRLLVKERLASAPEYTCTICGKKFKSNTKNARFCSHKCTAKNPTLHKKSLEKRTRDTKMIPCVNCGALVRRNKTKRERSAYSVCSQACDKVHRSKMAKERATERARMRCANDACDVVGVYSRGLCEKCWQRWKMMQPEERHKHRGACLTCKAEFYSWYKVSLYCSRECYVKSDAFRAEREKYMDECARARIKRECLNCGTVMELKPSEVCEKRPAYIKQNGKIQYQGSKKFCCRACYREYFAARYDRYIAQGAHLNTPECYDQFLSQQSLPCLVEGCDWEGDGLSMHMNVAHGISADELKALAGFNRTTGVITTNLSRRLSEQAKRLGLGRPEIGENRQGNELCRPFRPEGIEHLKRARAIQYGTERN